jgi:hypothetical protein
MITQPQACLIDDRRQREGWEYSELIALVAKGCTRSGEAVTAGKKEPQATGTIVRTLAFTTKPGGRRRR